MSDLGTAFIADEQAAFRAALLAGLQARWICDRVPDENEEAA